MPLNDPVPSNAADVANRNFQDLDRVLNTTGTVTTRTNKVIKSLSKAIQDLGLIYGDPIPDWSASTIISVQNQVYRYPATTGDLYIPKKAVPFTTGATFNTEDWQPVQNAVPSEAIDSILDLKSFEPTQVGQTVYLSGYSQAGIGGGRFSFNSSDLSSFVSIDTKSGIYVPPNSDPTGSSGAWVRVLNDIVTPEMFGLIPSVDFTDEVAAAENKDAFNAAIVMCPEGKTVSLSSPSVVNGPVVIDRGYINVSISAKLYPSDGFTGDYLVTSTFESSVDYFRFPLIIKQMLLDCRWISRGFFSVSMDHADWNSIRVENPLGSGIFIDRMRESRLSYPLVINAKHRERFATPSDWLSATAYVVGDLVRVKDPDWAVGSTYSPDDIVRHAGDRFIAKGGTTGEQPDVNPLVWQQLPHEDYECLIGNTNKDPYQFNTNATSVGDRYWQKVYQDEACIEISDVILTGDRSNQIGLFEPVVRDSGNKCYLRVDSSKLPARPVTHFDIIFGHIHGQPVAQAGGEIPIPDLQRVIELGYTINTNIIGTNIRAGDGERCIGVMIGDGGTTKVTQDTRFSASVVSGDGVSDLGVLVMPSTQPSNASDLGVSFIVTDANSTDLHDPRRTFRKNYNAEQRVNLPKGLNSVPGGVSVIGPNGEYGLVRPFSYQEEGQSQPRIDWNISGSSSEIRFGDGISSPDAILRRNSTGRLSTPSEFRLEGGTWDNGLLIIGIYRLWVDATGVLRIKNSPPSSDTDGTVVGTQT